MIRLLFALSAFAQIPDKVPAVFCEGSLQVSERTDSCDANTNYLQAVKACMAKLDALENSLGADANAIAQGAAASQQGKAVGGANTYGFSSAALIYLKGVAGVAKDQVVDYKKYVAPPADEGEDGPEDPMELAAKTPCFVNTVNDLAKAEQELANKISRYSGRLAQAQAFEKTLKGASSDFGSMNKAVTGKAQDQALPKGTPKNRESDVSGTLEPEKVK